MKTKLIMKLTKSSIILIDSCKFHFLLHFFSSKRLADWHRQSSMERILWILQIYIIFNASKFQEYFFFTYFKFIYLIIDAVISTTFSNILINPFTFISLVISNHTTLLIKKKVKKNYIIFNFHLTLKKKRKIS